MPSRNPEEIKRKILSFLERNGPSLPVHLAKEVGMDMIFTSAFLSELISNKKVNISFMKVGTSPIYFLPGTESGLERFSEYLKGKELETFNKLKEKGFLEDTKEESATRVALRQLRDFAIPFEKEGRIVWKYYLAPEKELEEETPLPKKEEQPEKISEAKPEEESKEKLTQETIEKPKEETKKAKPEEKKKRTSPQKKKKSADDDKFFNRVKEYLQNKDFEILDIMGFNKKDLVLKVKKDGKEVAAIAFNKKRITEKEILSAHKRSSEMGLNYIVLSLGETPKKTQSWIDAAKSLASMEKMD